MLFALTSRTRFFPELAEAGYRCFETEPCDDVRVGVATLRCGPTLRPRPAQLLWAVLDWLLD